MKNISKSFLFSTICILLMEQAAVAQQNIASTELFHPSIVDSENTKNATVYFFTGGAGEVLSETGGALIQNAVNAGKALGTDVQGKMVGWSSYQSVCQSIANDQNRGRVILIGHSYGGHAALGAAHCLSQANIRVHLLITIDTVYNGGIDGSEQYVPKNVVINYNLYQRRDILLQGVGNNLREGFPKNQRPGIYSRLIRVMSVSPHTAIDDQTLTLQNFLVNATLARRLRCIAIPGNDIAPTSDKGLEVDKINEQNFLRNTFDKGNSC
jgi:hypothetical protein